MPKYRLEVKTKTYVRYNATLETTYVMNFEEENDEQAARFAFSLQINVEEKDKKLWIVDESKGSTKRIYKDDVPLTYADQE